jgi:hypothetical protein
VRLFGEDVEHLTVEQYREAVAAIRAYLVKRIRRTRTLPQSTKRFLLRFSTVQNVIRTLIDSDTLHRMARMDPVPKPKGLDDEFMGPGHLVRTGHPTETTNVEVAVSANLYGSKLVSYFYIAGEDFPNLVDDVARKKLLEKLVVHDSDEFVYFLGRSHHQSTHGKLPIFIEGCSDPYQHVWNPISVHEKQWFLFDGKAPHYWFGEKNSVAFYVSGSAGGLWRKPIAFGWHHNDFSPGGSYVPFRASGKDKQKNGQTRDTADSEWNVQDEASQLDKLKSKAVQTLLGKRLRRRRDAYQISAQRVQELNPEVRGIQANTIGKVENAAFETLHLRTVAEFAEAMDMTLMELFVRDPPYEWSESVLSQGRPVAEHEPAGYDLPTMKAEKGDAPLFDEKRLREPFAIRPYLLKPQRKSELSKLKFWQGEADVALLVLEGKVSVYVAPDPLLLALELAMKDKIEFNPAASAACFELTFEKVDDLVKKQRLLLLDEIKSNEAYHFSAALPHAVISTDDNAAIAIAVIVRNDRRLPDLWLGKKSDLR